MTTSQSVRLIKGTRSGSRLIKSEVVEAREEAATIRQNAEDYAREIVREANQKASDLRARAKKEGFESGLCEVIENVVATARLKESAVAEAEHQIIELSISIAEKILGKELEERREGVVDVVETGLRHVRHKHHLLIRVNPLDFETVSKAVEDIEKRTGGRFIEVMPESDVSAGGCIIENDTGTVDARIETQLETIRKALLLAKERIPRAVDEKRA